MTISIVTTSDNFDRVNVDADKVSQAVNVTTFTQSVEACYVLVPTPKPTANLNANSNCCKPT